MNAHEIDYRIYGEEMQFVEIELDPYETVVARHHCLVGKTGNSPFEPRSQHQMDLSPNS